MAKKKNSQGRRSAPIASSSGSGCDLFAAFSTHLVGKLTEERDRTAAEAMQQVDINSEMPLAVLAKKIRDGLHQNGTNVIMNDNDPMGDGDQSLIQGERQRQYHRELSATGGDFFNCTNPVNTLSPFATAVLTGNASVVREMLKDADTSTTGEGTPSKELISLLETRETSMRVSPMLLVVSMGKNHAVPGMGRLGGAMDEPHVAVAKLLLKYGARPDAQDVVGKTVFHYGAGAFASDMSLAVADLCLRAQEGGSHLFGKPVTLVKLSNAAMNGQQGIALGFDVDTGRRTVSLPVGNSGRRKVVAVKPENLKLTDVQEQKEVETRPFVRLCDVQDRLGGVCFTEVILQDRVDVAKFLLARKAKLDVVDSDGTSPLSLAMMQGAQLSSQVSRLINEHVSAAARRERRKVCSGCGKDEKEAAATFDLCAGCKSMRYCSRECQIQHWNASHKVECRAIQARKKERVVLDRPPEGEGCTSFQSMRTNGPRVNNGNSYQIPHGVRTGQKFTIKVQASGSRDSGTILIYNEARDCSFFLMGGQAGFKELYDVVKAEKATGGTKTFMKALFDEDGNCVAFPGDTSIHSW